MSRKLLVALKQNPRDAIYLAFTLWAAGYLVVYLIVYVATAHPPFDARGYLIGRDFLNTWMSGKAALGGHPATWFDFNNYNAALRVMFGASFPEHNWSYPPDILLFTWLFGFLSYIPAYVLWNVLGFSVYYFTVTKGEQRLDRLLFLTFAPAITANFLSGQNGLFTAALMLGGLMQLDKRPFISGVLFGLLSLKPQLGLLLPLMLCIKRRWVCIFSATATVTVLFVTTSVIFGFDIWREYFRVVLPVQNSILREGAGGFVVYMPTVFMNMRVAGFSPEVAWIVQAPASIFAIAAVVWSFWKKRDPILSQTLFVTASLVVTPYMFTNDMVMLCPIIAQLRERRDGNAWDDAIALSVWLLPITAGVLGLSRIPLSGPLLLLFLVRLVWRIRKLSI